ncbi:MULTISPECIES: acyl-CoA dehydrogenase family protein [unclassified Amycolatopsis]|uniref:acyl-CoA dehydrogenase family protein n=1 Tax=unclassified Amycolatopsis TaxID=2618356 RepID=UPI00287B6F63|nr:MULTISPECIES: acyl-CoA dehydrogenase family protein [unclassified Amycolatopsis]
MATLPRFQTGAGAIAARITGVEEIRFGLARRAGEGDPAAAAHAGVGKVLATRLLVEAVEQAVALAGNPGLTRADPLQRHYRDVPCSRVHTSKTTPC